MKIRFNFCRYAISITGEAPSRERSVAKFIETKSRRCRTHSGTKRISKDGEKGRGTQAVCAGDMQLICPKAVGQHVEGAGQLHCSTAGSLCACRITNFPGDQGQQQQQPCHMPCHTHTHIHTVCTAGSIEPNRAQSASSGVIVKRSICPSGKLLLQQAVPASACLPLPAAFVATATCATF